MLRHPNLFSACLRKHLSKSIQSFGFAATNSISGGTNLMLFDKTPNDSKVFDASSDAPCIVVGAAVKVPTYLQLVEGFRQGRDVRQRGLATLGRLLRFTAYSTPVKFR